MATDWAADVKKYAKDADDGVIAAIVRYCGIALRNRDSSLVAFSDPTELARVRTNFLQKKLALTDADSVLDAAIAKVGELMKADRTKNRVTVYYLLAAEFGKLGLFAPKGKVAAVAAPAAKAAAPVKAPAKAPAKTAAKAAAPAAKPPAKAKPAAKTAKAAGAAVAGAAGVTALASVNGAKSAKPAAKKPTAKATTTKTSAAKATVKPVTAAAPIAAPAPKPASAPAPAPAPVAKAAELPTASASIAAPAAATAATTAATTAAARPAAATQSAMLPDKSDESGLGWLWLVLGLALLVFLAWWLFGRTPAVDTAAMSTPTEAVAGTSADGSATAVTIDLAAAPAEGTVAIPAGAGVTSETRDSKPVVKVYFDSGMTAVAPAFADAAGGLKAWLDANPGSALQVSGYNDPTGNAAKNAELSKQRAQAVAADLVKAGIPEGSVALVKPEATTDASVSKESARRVEVTVK